MEIAFNQGQRGNVDNFAYFVIIGDMSIILPIL